MREAEGRIRVSLARLFYSIVLIVAAVSVTKFAYITVESFRLQREVEQLEGILASDTKALQKLQQQKAYAMSEAYAERVTRGEFQMAKEGEVNISPIFPQGVDQASLWDPQPRLQKERTPPPNWQNWWIMFFPPD